MSAEAGLEMEGAYCYSRVETSVRELPCNHVIDYYISTSLRSIDLAC